MALQANRVGVGCRCLSEPKSILPANTLQQPACASKKKLAAFIHRDGK